jgi:hypothetical protein
VITASVLFLLVAAFTPLSDLGVIFSEAMKFGKRFFRLTGGTGFASHGRRHRPILFIISVI